MPAQGRLGDNANVPSDGHGSVCCDHNCTGPGTSGSEDVLVNGQPALRIDDVGTHSSCCGSNSWVAVAGAPAVLINGRKAHRLGDATQHCGGAGKLIEGSNNVEVGDHQAQAQSATEEPWEGDLEFTVVTDDGVPVPNVDVEIRLPNQQVITARTDKDGRVRAPGVAKGTATVNFKQAFRVTKVDDARGGE